MERNGELRLAEVDARLWPQDDGPQLRMLLPYGVGEDRAEAITRLPDSVLPDHWLVLYDAPSAQRQAEAFVVMGDLLQR